MHKPNVLLVSNEPDDVHSIASAFAEVLFPRPVHREGGKSAAVWAGANDCHLCILNYELPDMDGLEAMAAIRLRNPNVPFIMYSRKESVDVAVSAFRAGVVDYIPDTEEMAKVVTIRAQRFLSSLQLDYASTFEATRSVVWDAKTDPELRDIPEYRLQPTYQNRLRVIGRQLDVYQYRSLTLFEVSGGFVVRVIPRKSRMPEALEFLDRDFPHMMKAAFRQPKQDDQQLQSVHPLLPTGYEDFMRALGYKLDEMLAEAIKISETPAEIVVGGLYKAEATIGTHIEEFQLRLGQNEIEYMLDEAYRRRGTTPHHSQSKEEKSSVKQIFKKLN